MSDAGAEPDESSFASRLSHLMTTVHPADRGPYSYREIAAGIQDLPGAMTATHVGQLATGKQPFPRIHYVQALASFFGVPAAYFFDESTASTVNAELERVLRWRDDAAASSDELSQRVAALPEADRDVISTMVAHLEQYEQQPRARRARRKPPRSS